jgi:mannosyltransferase
VSRRGRYVLGGILLAAAAIRLYRLDHFSYGLDEILQGFWIKGSWDFFWRSLRGDAYHPPLDYLIDRLFEALGPGDAVRKLPSIVWGLGTIAAFAAFLSRRVGETAGLASAALLALAPFHVRFSQELRPYSLGLLFVCLSLYALDRFLERPRADRLALLYLACLGACYALYTAAFVLALVAGALIVEDCASPDASRRRAARRFLLFSPAFGLALWLGYLPWWAVLRELASRPPAADVVPLTLTRVDRILAFLAFAPDDGYRLGVPGAIFVLACVAGCLAAAARPGARFLLAWCPGALVAIEILGRIHPHYDFARRFVPAGPGLVAAAGLGVAALLVPPVTRLAGAALLAAFLVFDARGLRVYFREGRADWRTLADFLRESSAPSERVFTENQYSQMAVAFYLVGPEWLSDVQTGRPVSRDLPNLEGQPVRLTWAWKPGTRAWLVLAGVPWSEPLRAWARGLPCRQFPRAEHAVLCRLDPDARDASLALISGAHGP